jgi:hypothetical protein
MLKKQLSDYLLLAGGIGLNFFLPAMILNGSKLGMSSELLNWFITAFIGVFASFLLIKRWNETFIIKAITTEHDADLNFKTCHIVLKEYRTQIIDNNYNEKQIRTKISVKHTPFNAYITIYCDQNYIFISAIPNFNFWLFLFSPTGINRLIRRLTEKSR